MYSLTALLTSIVGNNASYNGREKLYSMIHHIDMDIHLAVDIKIQVAPRVHWSSKSTILTIRFIKKTNFQWKDDMQFNFSQSTDSALSLLSLRDWQHHCICRTLTELFTFLCAANGYKQFDFSSVSDSKSNARCIDLCWSGWVTNRHIYIVQFFWRL